MTSHTIHATLEVLATIRKTIEETHCLRDAAKAIGRSLEWTKRECLLNGIPLPQRGDARRFDLSDEQTTWLEQQASAGRLFADCARELGMSKDACRRALKRLGVRLLFGRGGSRPGEHHKGWQGGRMKDKGGYVLVYAPDHPHATGGRQIYVREHRLVMEKHLGRYLEPGEVVHHRNGIRDDNRIENLELYASNAEHLREELAGRVPNWTEAGKARIWSPSANRKRGATQRGLSKGGRRKP